MHRSMLLIAIILVTATPLLAAPFTITVPNRVAGAELVPIARVRMTLECAADVPDGATLTVQEGAATKTFSLATGLQDFTNSNPDFAGPDPTNDQVRFRRDTTTPSRIHIELVLRHVMDDPTKFCVLEDAVAPPASWTYTLTFSGPPISGYRISSYGVGGLDTATTPTNCSKAPRRLANTPAFTNIETANPGVTNLGRHPHDIVLVLDNSGSMDWPTPGSPADRRMDVLIPAAQQFLGLWETEGLTVVPPTTGGTSLTTDRLGLIFFSTDLTIPFPGAVPGTTALTQRGTATGPGPAHPWNPINEKIGAATPTLSTSIGKGLQAAITTLTSSPNDSTIVLMTDGLQNTPPMVERPPSSVLRLSGSDLNSYGIPILTVSLGIPGGIDPELLDDIARQTAGRSRLTATSSGTATAFAGSLVTALLGDTLLVATEGSDTLAAGAAASAPLTIPLDASIRRVAFTLGWSPKLGNALDLDIIPPGATQPVAPATATGGAGWRVYGADIPATGPAGNWTVRIRRARQALNNQSPEVPYHFGAYTYEGKLDFAGMLPSQEQRTGDEIVVKTEVAFGNQSVTTADGRISLRVARPGESLGNLLHDLSVPPDVLTTETSGDSTTPYHRKLNRLTETIAPKIEPAVLPNSIPLHHEGNGLYSARFNDTTKTGQYQFLLTYDFDAPDGSGRIRRIEQLERVLKLKPDARATNVVVTAGRGDLAGTYTVVVTPKDRFGNYLGPGAPGRIHIAVSGIGTVSAISDPQQTGDYVATVTGVPAGTVPDIRVTVDEVSVPVKSGLVTPAYRFFLDIGPNFPQGDFNKAVDGRWSVNAGLERFVAANTSLEGIVGYHAFKARFTSNPRIWQLSVNVKQYFGPGPLHFFVNAGAGAYRFDPGSTTKFGWNAGTGVLYDVSASWGVEGVYNLHSIDTGVSTTRFSTVQIGIRRRVF